MADSFPCPTCSHLLNVSDARESKGDRALRCPRCFTEVVVRSGSSAPSIPLKNAAVPVPPAPPVRPPALKIPAPPPVSAARPASQPAQMPAHKAALTSVKSEPAPISSIPLPPANPPSNKGSARRFQVAAIAICGLLILAAGAAGLSGVFSRRLPESVALDTKVAKLNRAPASTPEKIDIKPVQDPIEPESPTIPAKNVELKKAVPQKTPRNDTPAKKPTLGSPRPVANQESRPIATVQLLSIDALFDRMRWLDRAAGEKFGMAPTLNMLRAMITQFGIPGDRYCGAYGHLDEVIPAGALVFMLPVRSEESFRQALAEGGFSETHRDANITELSVPILPVSIPIQLPSKCYLRFANGYAHICMAGDGNLFATAKLPALEQVFDQSEKRLLTATVRSEYFPKQAHDQWNVLRGQLHSKIAAVDANTAEYGEQFADMLTALMDDILTGKHRLRFSLDIGETDISADVELMAESGSRFAASLGSLAGTPSRFGELFLDEAALGTRVNVRMPEKLRALMPGVVRSATKLVLAEEGGDPYAKALAERLFHALEPTVGAGELDAVLALFSNGAGQPGCAFGALKIVDGKSFDRFVQETVNDPMNAEIAKLIQLNAEPIADVRGHVVSNRSLPAEVNVMFGDHPVIWAFGTDMLGYCMGMGGKARLAQMLQAKPEQADLFEMSANFKQIQEVTPFPGFESSAKAFSTSDPGRLRIRLKASDGLLHLRVAVSRSVLSAAMDRVGVNVQFAPAGVK
ncbi:MAG: hypothetical protein JWM11_2406 [Planctomycetaceae bacterium]|nr:hypothetical protein [Planctomycetaceae bacterium]